MLKQVMNNNKRKVYILFFILYVTQIAECKVAYRRDDGEGAKVEEGNAIADEADEGANDSTADQPSLNEADDTKKQPDVVDAVGSSLSPDGKKKKLDHDSDLESPNDCWISLNEQNHFVEMHELEQKYKDVRKAYANDFDPQHLDRKMLAEMSRTRAVAERALQKFRGDPNVIPAGLNLGSYSMMRMPGSMLFFYRLKLRNNTRFTINFLHNDVEQLTLTLRLSLNDLHLLGEYERAITSKEDPSVLYYRPNKGEVEFLLKDVKYKVEGRYRLLNDRLHIEHIISEIPPMQILMRYTADTAGKSMPLDPNSLSMISKIKQDYLNRMQNDLDHWLKDYFNDFLLLYGVEEVKKNKEIQEYENEKTILLNAFSDKVMNVLNGRLREKGSNLMMPEFTLTAVNGMEIRLYDGIVRGLDTMYRRSVTTGKLVGEVRYVDADIGFSGLKAEYRYETFVKTGMPPVSGVFVLKSDDVSAHMALQIVGYKPSVPDLLITYMRHGKPESLTVEGPASRIIANFNHLLEHHIISIMSSTLIHHIRSLSALTKCDPRLPTKDGQAYEEDRHQQTLNTDDYGDDQTTPMKPNFDDGPTEAPGNDDDGPTELPNDDDGPTELPGNDDDGPTESPDDDGGPTEFPDNDDRLTELPDNDDDGPTEFPENDDDDNVPTEPQEYTGDDESTKRSENDGDVKPTEPLYNNNDDTTDPPENDDDNNYEPSEPSFPENDDNNNSKDKKPEYAFARKESVELEVPAKDGSAKGQSYKIDHNEKFSLTKLNNNNDETLLTPGGDAADGGVQPKKDYRGQIVKLMDSGNED